MLISAKTLATERASYKQLIDAATKLAGDYKALADAQVREIQSLQDEVVDLQVRSGEALDRVAVLEREAEERERYLRELLESPMGRLLRSARRFVSAVRRGRV